MAHGGSMAISRGVNTLLEEMGEVKPTVLYAVPQLFKRICDAIHAKVLSTILASRGVSRESRWIVSVHSTRGITVYCRGSIVTHP